MKTKNIIRKWLNIDNNKKIIFTGFGTTCAINHLIYCLKLDEVKKVNILLTQIEHHSNYLPWIELSKKYNNIKIIIIPIDDNLKLDINFIETIIKDSGNDELNIVTITACSNVIGVKTDIKSIHTAINKYNNNNCCYGKKNLLFVDYACCAPYTKIDGRICDALFFSPHKFLGGVGTPGVLVANTYLFHNKVPFTPGGGCVKKVCSKIIQYDNDIEKKETAGTPNIIGIIKIGKIIELQMKLINIIQNNEHKISKYVFYKFNEMMKQYNNLIVLYPELDIDNRIPIVCIAIKGYHYNLIVVLLNDLFGIQTRGGTSCTGLLAEIINKKYNIVGWSPSHSDQPTGNFPVGWCRITFNWLMDREEIDYIIDGVKFIIENINKFSNYYEFDKDTNLFFISGSRKRDIIGIH